MKLNKTTGRVATTLVATAMLASLAAVPAFAAGGVQGATDTTINSLTITKKLNMPDGVVTSEKATFAFTLTGATADPGETITSSNVSLDVMNGTGTATDTVEFAAGTKKGNGDTANVEFTFNSSFTFSNPGVYKYTIDESEVNTNAGYSDVTSSLDVYLFVKKAAEGETDTCGADDGYLIYAAVVAKDSNNPDKTVGNAKTETWENNYKTDATSSLAVTKRISGDMASPNDEFSFTMSDLTPNRTYVVSSGYDSSIKTMTAGEDGTVSFTLKANQTWTIYGLEAGTYTVTEGANSEGYELTNMTYDSDNDVAGAQVVVNGEAETEFTNTRNAVTPTGIVMNVAPYALLVVIAAAGCFVFLRKRRED